MGRRELGEIESNGTSVCIQQVVEVFTHWVFPLPPGRMALVLSIFVVMGIPLCQPTLRSLV